MFGAVLTPSLFVCKVGSLFSRLQISCVLIVCALVYVFRCDGFLFGL